LTNASGNFAVQLNQGAFTSNGVKKLGVYATDLSGTRGDIQPLTINLQASTLVLPQQPPTTPTLVLSSADDSSQGQAVTNVRTVHLVGTTTPGTTVSLFQVVNTVPSGSPLSTTTSDSNGHFSLTAGPLADGSYTFQAQATNSFGTTTSGQTSVTIETQ